MKRVLTAILGAGLRRWTRNVVPVAKVAPIPYQQMVDVIANAYLADRIELVAPLVQQGFTDSESARCLAVLKYGVSEQRA